MKIAGIIWGKKCVEEMLKSKLKLLRLLAINLVGRAVFVVDLSALYTLLRTGRCLDNICEEKRNKNKINVWLQIRRDFFSYFHKIIKQKNTHLEKWRERKINCELLGNLFHTRTRRWRNQPHISTTDARSDFFLVSNAKR